MLVGTELLVALAAGVRFVEEVQAQLQSQYAAHSIVDALHLHLAFLHEFLQQYAEVHAVGIHRHVDTCIHGHAHGVLLVLGHVLSLEEVVDVGPVGHKHAVPLQVFLQPLRQVFVAGVHGLAVDGARVHHHRQRSGQRSSLEGLEVLLAQHLRRHVSRRAVLAAPGSTVGEVVLRARAHVVAAQVVGVVALIAANLGFHHAGIDDGILAEALVDARPARVAAKVYHGIVHPRAVSSAAFVSRNLCPGARQLGVERCSKVDGLRKERTRLSVGDAVVVVETVDIGDADVLHRLLLDEPNPLLPLLHGGGTRGRCIQDAAHLPILDNRVEHLLVQLPLSVGIIGAHDVEVQLEHLSDFLVERHLREHFLNLRLHRFVARDGRLAHLCPCGNNATHEQHSQE